MTRLVLMIVLAIVLTTSCKEEDIYLSEIEGSYIGTYTTAGPELLLITTPTIELKNGKFN